MGVLIRQQVRMPRLVMSTHATFGLADTTQVLLLVSITTPHATFAGALRDLPLPLIEAEPHPFLETGPGPFTLGTVQLRVVGGMTA